MQEENELSLHTNNIMRIKKNQVRIRRKVLIHEVALGDQGENLEEEETQMPL